MGNNVLRGDHYRPRILVISLVLKALVDSWEQLQLDDKNQAGTRAEILEV